MDHLRLPAPNSKRPYNRGRGQAAGRTVLDYGAHVAATGFGPLLTNFRRAGLEVRAPKARSMTAQSGAGAV
jgi:hypothetical protein